MSEYDCWLKPNATPISYQSSGYLGQICKDDCKAASVWTICY